MKKLLTIAMLLLAAQILVAGQPRLVKATLEPVEVSPGGTIKLYIEFTGSSSDLKEVYLTVREYPWDYPKIPLTPVKGKKNVWADDGQLPYETPAGTYHFDINAIDKKGKEIVSKGFEESETGKAGTIKMIVK